MPRALLLAALCAALPFSGARAEVVCTVIGDGASGKLLMEEGDCDRRVMPASTFKLAISLMGYDSGFLADEHAPALPFQEGYPDWIESWKATTDPTGWMKNSVVWYSQQVTQALGKERLQRYMADFSYGNEDVSGDPGKDNGLTRSWLSSSLEISPREQVAFLEKIVKRELPISAHAYDMTSRITSLGTLPNGWDVHGKQGQGRRSTRMAPKPGTAPMGGSSVGDERRAKCDFRAADPEREAGEGRPRTPQSR